jgi:hypothetical protein
MPLKTLSEHEHEILGGKGSEIIRTGIQCVACALYQKREAEYLTRADAKLGVNDFGVTTQFCWCEHNFSDCGSTAMIPLPLPEQVAA